MRFQEAYAGWQEKRLTQEDAGQLLGVSARTFRRQIGRFEADGMQGLIDLRMSQVSSRRAPVDEVLGLQQLYGSDYSGERPSTSTRATVAIMDWDTQLQLGEERAAGGEAGGALQGTRQAPQEARAQASAGDDGAPGREHP